MRDDATASHPANTIGLGRSAQPVSINLNAWLLALLAATGAAYESGSMNVQAAGGGPSRMILAQNEPAPKRAGPVRLDMFAASAAGLVDALMVPEEAERGVAIRPKEPAAGEGATSTQNAGRSDPNQRQPSETAQQTGRDTDPERKAVEAPGETRSVAGTTERVASSGDAVAAAAKSEVVEPERGSHPEQGRGRAPEVAATDGVKSVERSVGAAAGGGPGPAASVVQKPDPPARAKARSAKQPDLGYPVDPYRDQWKSVFGDP
jgi:hypothetical protein